MGMTGDLMCSLNTRKNGSIEKKESADLSASQSVVFFSHTKSALVINTFLLQQISTGYQPQPAGQNE
jgi:hypothetical protein